MNPIPNHVGFIPNGNRRFARRRGLTLAGAYSVGARKALEIVKWCHAVGIREVSFFGTSHENVLGRPRDEMTALHQGILEFCQGLPRFSTLHLVGDVLGMTMDDEHREAFKAILGRGRGDGKFLVHADVNYSGELAFELAPLFGAIERFGLGVVRKDPGFYIASAGVSTVDLLIRTGGEHRLSGFLPFQTQYAELRFLTKLWGDFSFEDFHDALDWYAKQDRTKGA